MKLNGSDFKNRIFFIAVFLITFLLCGAFSPRADLLFAVSIVCGIISDDRKGTAIIALVSGTLCDMLITRPQNLSPLLFFLGAYYAKKTVSAFTSTNAVAAAAASAPFFFLRAVTECVYILSETSGVSVGSILKAAVLPEFAFNVTAAFFAYIIVGFLHKRFKRRFFV